MRLAAISDIHGNLWALRAVLADIERRGIAAVVNLGDSLYGPLDPAGTADFLMESKIVCIRGNQDRSLLDTSENQKMSPSLRFTRQALLPRHYEWLKSLQPTASVEGSFFLCHGTPQADNVYLLEGLAPGNVFLRKTEELVDLTGGVREEVILCGHSHVARTVQAGKKLIINAGSVGLPAYDEPHPPCVMEAGSPHARYVVLEGGPGAWVVSTVAVTYDWEAAIRTAQAHNRPDWVEWLATGRATVPQI